MRLRTLLLPALALLTPAVAATQPLPAANSLVASVLAGYQGLDAGREVDDGAHGAFGLAFRFTPRTSLELTGGRTDSEAGGESLVVDTLRLDGLWHLDGHAGWYPFLAAGAGNQRLKQAGVRNDRETQLVAGAGLFRPLGGPFLLRLEWRLAYSLDEEAWDHLAAAGLAVAFGGGTPPPATAE